jgi:hypothetical protein
MRTPATDRARAEYKPRTHEERQRRIQYGRFPEAMRQAYGGNLEPLHKYLDTFLPSDHATTITEFQKRRLRPDYKQPLSLEQEAAKQIAAVAKIILDNERKRDGTIPPKGYQRAIDKATERLWVDGELDGTVPASIDFKKIRTTVRRGKKKKSSTITNKKP